MLNNNKENSRYAKSQVEKEKVRDIEEFETSSFTNYFKKKLKKQLII